MSDTRLPIIDGIAYGRRMVRVNSISVLNKRDELVSKCHQMNKFTLKRFKNR